MTQPLDPETDNSCWCSDRMSGGIPCPPGTCPNRPKLDPETERHIKWLTDSAAAMDPHCPEASNLYRKNGAHMRKLAQEVAERGINIDTLIRSRDTAQRELSWAQAALAAERTVRENAERELADLRRQYDTLRENHVELQKEAATLAETSLDLRATNAQLLAESDGLRRRLNDTKAELERLRDGMMMLAQSWWAEDEESALHGGSAELLALLHERNKP